MSDVVCLQIAQSVFWFVVTCIVIGVFHRELKGILQSIGRFEVAGAAFHLNDRKETLRSYALLSDILIDLLSKAGTVEAMSRFMTASQINVLGTFALKYTAEIAKDEWDDELLKNIAYLLLRFGRYKHAVQLYDSLLEKRPDHVELINLKALALMTSRLPDPVRNARELLQALTKRYPEYAHIRFNYALSLSLSENAEQACEQMRRAISDGYFGTSGEEPLQDPLFHYVRESRPDLFEDLQAHLRRQRVISAQQVLPPDARDAAPLAQGSAAGRG